MRKLCLGALFVAALLGLAGAARADVVLDWNEVLHDAIRVDGTPPPRVTPAATASTCRPGPATLCLNGGRFKVEAQWSTGGSGPGHAESLGEDSGRFWFFSEDNTELVVKVLNACLFDDRYWVFASGLTNVEVIVTVTDTQAGKVRRYFNPQGKAFAPVQDVQAFATFP